MKTLRWLGRHWYIPLFVIGAILGAVMAIMLRKPTKGIVKETRLELKAIDAKSETKKMEAELGAQVATETVKRHYAETYMKLEHEEKEKARELEDDPAALAAFLVHAGADHPDPGL